VFSFLLLAFAADSRAAVDMDRKAARRPRLLLLTRHAAISPDRFDHKNARRNYDVILSLRTSEILQETETFI